MKSHSKRFYIVLSVAAAVATMSVKFVGYLLTRSVGLFSDAAESVVNLVAALVALWTVTLASKPADEEHTYGHSKSEYFSSGVEGALIFVAALVIAVEALPRLWHPQPLEQVGLGLAFSVSGAAINGVLAWFMLRAGKEQRSGCHMPSQATRGNGSTRELVPKPLLCGRVHFRKDHLCLRRLEQRKLPSVKTKPSSSRYTTGDRYAQLAMHTDLAVPTGSFRR